jgi:23S rRNA (pseudouridine1915-N3)-methyltransferase
MARLRILAVTENKEKWLQAATHLYHEKIEHFCKCEIVSIKPYKEARAAIQEKIKKETESILKKIDEKDHVILCDLQGAEYSSLEFAKKMQNTIESVGSKNITFIIGGAYGVGDELKRRAKERIKLSEMTMNHYVAHTMLLEQIYRAFTIIKGLPYHNE